MASAVLPAPGVSPKMGDSRCWRPHMHSLGLGENPSFHCFPITSTHFKLIALDCIRNRSSQAGKSHKPRYKQAKSKCLSSIHVK